MSAMELTNPNPWVGSTLESSMCLGKDVVAALRLNGLCTMVGSGMEVCQRHFHSVLKVLVDKYNCFMVLNSVQSSGQFPNINPQNLS